MQRLSPDLRLFLAGFVAYAGARIAQTAQIHSVNIDGGYYLEVAKHVRDGDGLVSDLSLYHFAYPSFPYPTSVYPLWPLLLGTVAKVADLETVGHWLPMVLSLVAVWAAWGFGRRLWPVELLPDHVPGLHLGHVLALLLAVQSDFVWYTSLPYTEALAWTLLYGFCWRVAAMRADTSILWALETGGWLALLYFARAQLIVVPMAMACTYALRIALGPDRLRLGVHATVALGVVGAALLGWWLHLRTFVADAGPSALLRFDQNRASDLLQPFDVIVDTSGPLALLGDRLFGFLIAYDASPASYMPGFYTVQWAVPAVLPLVAAAVLKARRMGVPAVAAWLREPARAPWIFAAILGLGSLLSVHAVHKQYNGEWYFGTRQGLMSLPAFGLPLAWLLWSPGGPAGGASPRKLGERRRWTTVVGVVLLASTFASGVQEVWGQVTSLPDDRRGDEPYDGIVNWLDRAAKRDGGRVVVAFDAANVQRVGWQTTGVGYHWFSAKTSYDDLLKMTDQLGARYVVLRERATSADRGWAFLADPARVERDFVRLPEMPGKHVIFERRR